MYSIRHIRRLTTEMSLHKLHQSDKIFVTSSAHKMVIFGAVSNDVSVIHKCIFLLQTCMDSYVAIAMKCDTKFPWNISYHFSKGFSFNDKTHCIYRRYLTHLGRLTHIYESVQMLTMLQIMACRLFGATILSEPMLPYCQFDTKEHYSVKFYLKFVFIHGNALENAVCEMAAILCLPQCVKTGVSLCYLHPFSYSRQNMWITYKGKLIWGRVIESPFDNYSFKYNIDTV